MNKNNLSEKVKIDNLFSQLNDWQNENKKERGVILMAVDEENTIARGFISGYENIINEGIEQLINRYPQFLIITAKATASLLERALGDKKGNTSEQ